MISNDIGPARPIHIPIPSVSFEGGIAVKTPRDALALPKGHLWVNRFDEDYSQWLPTEVAVRDDHVIECSLLLIKNNDSKTFRNQAEVLAYAAAKYGWGSGTRYDATT